MVWPEYIKSHRHLFEKEDVNLKLNSHAKDDLELYDIQNEDLSLHDLIDLSLKIILDKLE